MITAKEVAAQAQEIRDNLSHALSKTVTSFSKKQARDVDDMAFELGVEWAGIKLAAVAAILKGGSRAHFVGLAGAVFDELEQEMRPKQ